MNPTPAVTAPTDDVLGDLDGIGIAGRISSGDITAAEAVQAVIGRLESVDPALSAVVSDRFEQALAEAGGSAGGSASDMLLSGVPTVIKDNADVAGMVTRQGSRAAPAIVRDRDSAITTQLRATGLIPVAKSALPEFGLTATTEPIARAPTRNPWNIGYSAGGSSGGSAALVAARAMPIAHGNDGGGSIRIPASCCGLVGLKPSRGRLRTIAIADRLPINIIAEGVLTRSVRDTAAFYALAERYYAPPDLPPIGHVAEPAGERLRIGLSSAHPLGEQCHPEVVDAVERAGRLCEDLGHRVEPIPGLADRQMAEDFLLYWARLAAVIRYLGRLALGPGFDRHGLEPLTEQLSRHYLRRPWHSPAAIRRLRRFGLRYQQRFIDHDVIITPVLSRPPVPIGFLAPDLDFDTAKERLTGYAAFTPVQNVAGTPAISLPLGVSADALPIGVQFAAAMGMERRLLALALELEQAAPW